jgi:hypothetical protein
MGYSSGAGRSAAWGARFHQHAFIRAWKANINSIFGETQAMVGRIENECRGIRQSFRRQDLAIR